MAIVASAIAPPNIALIKYWGMRDNLLKLPLNDSISITLDANVLSSTTTIVLGGSIRHDMFMLNGQVANDAGIHDALALIRRRLAAKYPIIKSPILAVSENNFPTAAGIASSASGFAALAKAIALALKIKDSREISIIARLGSGSACRSVLGGFVRWRRGSRKDGEDSYAVQICPPSNWPEIVDVIAITDAKRKKVSSKLGMERTASTSLLFGCRLKYANKAAEEMASAVLGKNFQRVAYLAMRDSNSMHATMLDSWPPIMYLNDACREIIEAIHQYNEKEGSIEAAYTFDAGPNAHIITTQKQAGKIASILNRVEGVQKIIISKIGEGAKEIQTPPKAMRLIGKILRI
jgi:diphosphomevalonate decarboxylase